MASLKQKWTDETVKFTDNTTAHGLARVSGGQRPVWYRLIWLALFLTGTALAIFHSEERVREYMSHPFQIIETFETQAQIPFPSVTVCNAFPMPVLGNASSRVRETIDLAKHTQCYNNATYREHIVKETGASEEVLLFSVLDGEISNVSHEGKSFIAGCELDKKNCSYVNFTRYIDPDFYSCYTFHTTEHATLNKKLTLLLYLSSNGQSYKFSDVIDSFSSGAIVQVHGTDEHPSPLKAGTSVLPGTFNLIALKTYRTELLAQPVATNCTNRTLQNINYTYNIDVCYKVCLQKLLTEKCGCAFADLHIQKPNDFSGPFCFHDNCNQSYALEQYACVKDFYANIEFDSQCVECKMPACVTWDYVSHHTVMDYFIDFPAQDFVEDFLATDHASVADMVEIYGNISNAPNTFISKNFVKVTVTFTDTHVRHRKAVETMSGFSLFSDLGGAFSFWIGCSIITFIEFIEWIIRLIVCLGDKRVRSKKTENSDEIMEFKASS